MFDGDISPSTRSDSLWTLDAAANLGFSCRQPGASSSCLGYIIENNVIESVLDEHISKLESIEYSPSTRLSSIDEEDSSCPVIKFSVKKGPEDNDMASLSSNLLVHTKIANIY